MNFLKNIFGVTKDKNKIGITDPVCPHCGVVLSKFPGRKKKCDDCNNFIYVRTRPGTQKRILIKGDQIEEVEEQWSIINGTHDAFLEEKGEHRKEKDRLRKQFGREPSERDIMWGIYNKRKMEHAENMNWGLYRCVIFDMAELLKKENKFKYALELYLEVCYLDLNGPNNCGGHLDCEEVLKLFPPFDPQSEFAKLSPGVIERIINLKNKLKLSSKEIKKLFFYRGSVVFKALKLPLHFKDAWKKFEKKLFK